MSSIRKYFKISILFVAAGNICTASAIQAVPLTPEDAETAVSTSGAKDTNQAGETQISPKYQKIFPDIVAKVNGEPISGRDLEKALSGELASIGSPEWKNLREDYRGPLVYNLITGLINSKLLFDEAVASGINVSDSEVQDEYLRVAKTFKSDEEMKTFLADQDVSSEKMVQNIHQSLLIAKYVDETIRSKVTITPEELEKYYAENPSQFEHPDMVRTSHIMIGAGNNQKEDTLAKQRIDDIMARLGKGEDFAALAREYSTSKFASQGGDTGYATREMLPPEYAETAFSLPIGEIREVKTQQGYFIIKVTGKKKAGKSTLEESREQLAEFLVNEKTQRELQKKVNQLRDTADIEILIPAGVPLEP